jgi:hypothetical protein
MSAAKFTPFVVAAAFCALAATFPSSAFPQAAIVAPAARTLIEALEGYAIKAPARDLVDEIAEAGGRDGIAAFSTRLVDEGGETALTQAARLVREAGPAAIAALAKAPKPAMLLNALDSLPAEAAGQAVRALGRGADGEALAAAVDRFGAGALKLELQHPGVGTQLAQKLGDEGIAIARRMPTPDAILLARRAPEIASLPFGQRQALLDAVTKHLGGFVGFLESHPKFTFTAAATAVLLKEGDQIFGSSVVATDANGRPVAVARPGFVERFSQTFLAGIARPILAPIGSVFAALIAGWGAIKLWFFYRRSRLRERKA